MKKLIKLYLDDGWKRSKEVEEVISVMSVREMSAIEGNDMKRKIMGSVDWLLNDAVFNARLCHEAAQDLHEFIKSYELENNVLYSHLEFPKCVCFKEDK